MPKSSKKAPDSPPKHKFMITYLCSKCGIDSALTDAQKPRCFYCEAKTGLKEIKRQKISPQVMAERLKLVTDRMMEALQRAHAINKRDNDVEEGDLLKVMAKAKKLKDNVSALKLKKTVPKRTRIAKPKPVKRAKK